MFNHNPLHEELEKKSSQRPKYMSHHELSRFYQEKGNHQTMTRLKNQALSKLGDWFIALGHQLKSKSLDQQIALKLHQD
jgi:hypothetical protein